MEESTTGGSITKAYVYGEGIDEVVRASLPDAADLDGDLNTSETIDLYYHHNSLGSVVAVTDASGDIAESYEYRSYGKVSIFDDTGASAFGTQVEQPFMYTGRRWDFEEQSNLYYYRLRYYDPEAGRFVSRDPIGTWGDPGNRGNAQNYCGSNPVNCVDPLGDKSVWHHSGDNSYVATDDTVWVVSRIRLKPGSKGVGKDKLKAAKKKLREAANRWSKASPEFTDPRTGKKLKVRFKLEFFDEVSKEKRKRKFRDVRIHNDTSTLPESHKPPGMSDEVWEQVKKLKGKGVRKATYGDLSLDLSILTWMHELGHGLGLPDEEGKSMMNHGKPTGPPEIRHFLHLVFLALAANREGFNSRNTALGLCRGLHEDQSLQEAARRLLEKARATGKDNVYGTPLGVFEDLIKLGASGKAQSGK